jgi:hypothetical protein
MIIVFHLFIPNAGHISRNITLSPFVFTCFKNIFEKNEKIYVFFLCFNLFLYIYFFNYFDILMSKINFKKIKKYYFNIFLNE